MQLSLEEEWETLQENRQQRVLYLTDQVLQTNLFKELPFQLIRSPLSATIQGLLREQDTGFSGLGTAIQYTAPTKTQTTIMMIICQGVSG